MRNHILMEQADSIREQIKALLNNEDDTSGKRWSSGMGTGAGASKRQKAGKQASAPAPKAQLYFVSKTWLTGMCCNRRKKLTGIFSDGFFTDAAA